MWQKARQITDSPDDTPSDRGRIGGTFWVEGAPSDIEAETVDHIGNSARELRYRTNVILSDNRRGVIAARIVELLPEFAEDVPLISWQDFLEGKE